ncbi:glycoside hydrolase family 3 protein [Kribbella sp.]|uniref:glycoside hydrolase family 3 protein n=1 Tax=Kribbella sp. TaxID=1871183 RepID=UPI002D2B8E9D|nr:glycoside hydrolase family 3 C-terminal domain-containing protein [Kribbella sp.]HZX02112.1 glycoside hydrolase family 3 C-terminal domain-containing protein [Kribbella sp.]
MSTPTPRFRDPAQPPAERIDDLLARLTQDEKIALLHQYQPQVPRLGLEAFRTGTEALHGIAWQGPATVFPQAIGLAASWQPDLVRAIGSAVGDEVRVFHQKDPACVGLNVWAPVVNPLRDPRWGRNEEGYAEDPWLTGVVATAYARGLAGDHPAYLKTAPTLKHFFAYNNETDRCTTSSNVPPRVLHDYELPAYRAPIEAGAAVAVMPSYNLVNGRPAHLSPLINDVLRTWASEDILVVSDAYAPGNLFGVQQYLADGPTAYAAALKAGVDSFTQDDSNSAPTVERLTKALDRGLITAGDIDAAVRRVLAIRLRLGEFDPPELSPYHELEPELVNCPAHRRLAQEAARASIVMLKHDGRLLPLAASTLTRVAVIGPLAGTLSADLYAGTLPYQITALDGVAERLGRHRVEYHEGVDRISLRVAGTSSYVTVGPDAVLRAGSVPGEFDLFDWGGGSWALRSVLNGQYVTVADDGEVVADQPGPNGWEVKETFRLVRQADEVLIQHQHSGRYLSVDRHGTVGLADEGSAFEVDVLVDGAARAAELAAAAEVAIVVAGNHPLVNGRETEDRRSLDLPAGQERLVREVHSANPQTVLVLTSSYPFAIGWAEQHLPAILWSAHGGQEYGRALADVLFGDHDPSGRLTQTWYHSAADLPGLLDYDIVTTDATYLYYRGTPLYPFGHGLSYTTFAYGDLRLSTPSVPADSEVQVTFTVTNTGVRPGTEVAQLYTRQQRSRVKQPLRQLRGFRRISLQPGETASVELTVAAADLGFWDVTRDRHCVETAHHSIMVGRSSTDLRLTTTLDVRGERIPPRSLDLAATAFDEYCAVTLTAATPERGDAVISLEPQAWLAFDDVLLESTRYRARVANRSTLPATIQLRLDDPLHGQPLSALHVPPTDGLIEITGELTPATGPHTLYAVFSTADVVLESLHAEARAPRLDDTADERHRDHRRTDQPA